MTPTFERVSRVAQYADILAHRAAAADPRIAGILYDAVFAAVKEALLRRPNWQVDELVARFVR